MIEFFLFDSAQKDYQNGRKGGMTTGGLTACIGSGIGSGIGRGRGNIPTPGGVRIAVAKKSLISFLAMISLS